MAPDTEKRKRLFFALPNIILMATGVSMLIYSFIDQLPFELNFIADAYGEIGRGQFYLHQFGIMALIITCIAVLAFLDTSLLIHFVYSTLILGLVLIQMYSAVLIIGDERVDRVKMKLQMKRIMEEHTSSSNINHFLADKIQLTLDCCGMTTGYSWDQEVTKFQSGTCCNLDAFNPATNQCPFELSKLIPCDKAALTWVQFRVWKYFTIYFVCAFLESVCLILVLPASFSIKENRANASFKKKS